MNIRPDKLLVLSDMYGFENDIIPYYMNYSLSNINTRHYSLSQIAGIQNDQDIHSQYVEFGIEKAVNFLLEHESNVQAILAFSIGGTVAWRATLRGLKPKRIIAVSSTRLRIETQKPNCAVKLYYGEKDEYRPTSDWFESLKINPTILDSESHEVYKKSMFKKKIYSDLADSF